MSWQPNNKPPRQYRSGSYWPNVGDITGNLLERLQNYCYHPLNAELLDLILTPGQIPVAVVRPVGRKNVYLIPDSHYSAWVDRRKCAVSCKTEPIINYMGDDLFSDPVIFTQAYDLDRLLYG